MSNQIATLLSTKRNINIVLVCENPNFILTEDYPKISVDDASPTVRARYGRWVNANNKAGH